MGKRRRTSPSSPTPTRRRAAPSTTTSGFPAHLRTIGPDATGGIRPYLLDYVAIRILHPHPNVADGALPRPGEGMGHRPATRTVYFRIDPDARWSDGKPVTTDDVVFTFYFLRSPHLNEPWYNNYYTTKYDRQAHVYDKTDLRHHDVPREQARPRRLLAAASRTRATPSRTSAPAGSSASSGASSPPPAPTSSTTRTSTRAAPHLHPPRELVGPGQKFFRGRFNPDRYRLEVIRDPDKTAEAFARGDLDMLPLDQPKFWYETIPNDHPAVQAGYIVKAKFYNRIPRPDWGLWINSQQARLENRDIRLGIQYAANFDLVCRSSSAATPCACRPAPTATPSARIPTITARPFDPALAREHFAKAGYTTQGADGVLTNAAGQRLSFTSRPTGPTHARPARPS
jgi:microcin C transport system substrate-binding protein